ncbi:hypothetical protein PWY87_32990 [Kribbella solani]|uniref:hypothetical protein n=1 Tax=Kribbella solani TaxID=236067 RepID=UPI0029AC3F8E|nr:hypothetical protein [Kribbella solani]MDX3006540.1 hypothetical protein [Kribbella solani]
MYKVDTTHVLRVRRPPKREPPDLPAGHALSPDDLNKGDRIHHFDYGDGTIHTVTACWLHITWDNPAETLDYHSLGMARFLVRLEPINSDGV